MIRVLLSLVAFFTLSVAQADTLICYFTEPFFNVVYDTDTKTLHIRQLVAGENQNQVLTFKNVELKRLPQLEPTPLQSYAQYELQADTGETLLSLILNYRGSDGMSDFLYPYEAIHNRYYGGCESKSLSRVSLYEN